MEAEEVTVVVHGGRNLQSKKPGRCKFSVIFGVTSQSKNQRYRTTVVRDQSGNPDWNEESVMRVESPSDSVFFYVTEKDDYLGQVVLPVTSLTTDQGMPHRTTLKPHKKCNDPRGDLIFQAYVSKQRDLSMVAPQIRSSTSSLGPAQRTLARFRSNFHTSPGVQRRKRDSKDTGSVGSKEDKRRGSTLSFFNKKLSKSIHDIFHLGRMNNDDDDEANESKAGKKMGSMSQLNRAGQSEEVPTVTNIIPNMATVHGGTRLCVEGRHLGLGKSDIMEFMLCGSDLLDTIEFESDARIYVTTKANTPGKGDLWIETVSGGQGVVKNVFTFVDRSAEKTGSLERQPPPSPLVIPPSPGREPPQPSPKNKPRSQSLFREESGVNIGSTNHKKDVSVQRSSSQTQQDTKKPSSASLNGSLTLPRVKSSVELSTDDDAPEPPNRFRKNHQKHARRASESVVAMQRDADGRSSASEKTELQKEIVRLMKENEGLQKKNTDLNAYIQTLVAKVMEHCPEVLAAMPKQ